MKRKFIVLPLLLIIISSFFIPINQQENVSIKAPFIHICTSLLDPGNWEKWRPDLRQIMAENPDKITDQKGKNSLSIKYQKQSINVNFAGCIFNINDSLGNATLHYSFTIIPEKAPDSVQVIVTRQTNVIRYLTGIFKKDPFKNTHVNDLKSFWETDSLRYGCNIFKIKVPDANLVEIKREVLVKDKFTEAAKIKTELDQFMKTNRIKQMQPVIAQFLSAGKDSVKVNVGFFVDKKFKTQHDIMYVDMPKGGPLYCAKFTGKFKQRQIVYEGMKQYFADHSYQSVILPFEMYLDNKLPASDTDKVTIRINFSSYF